MFKRSSEVGADEPVTETFTAVSILNREGHAPAAVDGSVQPQHRRDADQEGEPDSRGVGLRGAIAGGAVLAGGAAVGVAALAHSEPAAGEMVPVSSDGDEGAYPGQGLLDAEVPAEAPLEPVVIDPAASTGSLDEAAPVVPPGAGPAHPGADGAGAASASPDPGGHDAGPDGSGGDDTAFGSGSGRDTSDDTSGGDTSSGDPSDADTGGGDEGGLLGVGSDDGVLDTGVLASDSDSESSGDEPEPSGDSGGEDDGGGGLLGTGLL